MKEIEIKKNGTIIETIELQTDKPAGKHFELKKDSEIKYVPLTTDENASNVSKVLSTTVSGVKYWAIKKVEEEDTYIERTVGEITEDNPFEESGTYELYRDDTSSTAIAEFTVEKGQWLHCDSTLFLSPAFYTISTNVYPTIKEVYEEVMDGVPKDLLDKAKSYKVTKKS